MEMNDGVFAGSLAMMVAATYFYTTRDLSTLGNLTILALFVAGATYSIHYLTDKVLNPILDKANEK